MKQCCDLKKVLLFYVALFLPIIGICGQGKDNNSVVKPITGTWINLAYKDVRNKYTNPQNFDNTDPKLWESKVRELSEMGIEYLVFMEVANEGKSYYPFQRLKRQMRILSIWLVQEMVPKILYMKNIC